MTTDETLAAEVRRFEALEIDPAAFRHADHVRVAFALLQEDDYLGALARTAATLKALTERAGIPEKFNLTITAGFLSLVAEHAAERPEEGWDAFIARCPGLLDSRLLLRWWSKERLASPAARRGFVLPDRVA